LTPPGYSPETPGLKNESGRNSGPRPEAVSDTTGITDQPGAFARLRYFLFQQKTGTMNLSIAVAIGVFIGVTPFYGLHTVLAIALAWAFRLNIGVTILATQIGNPLFAPFLIAGSAWLGRAMGVGGPLGGSWYDPTHARFYTSWLWGGLTLGLALGALCGVITFTALSRSRRRSHG